VGVITPRRIFLAPKIPTKRPLFGTKNPGAVTGV